jgi:hypothetical protein
VASKPETMIVRAIIDYVKGQVGGDIHHVHGSTLQRGGEPDLDGAVSDGIGGYAHIKIEVKTAIGQVEARQIYRLKEYRRYGYLVGIVHSLTEFAALIQEYQDWNKRQMYAAYKRLPQEHVFIPTATRYPGLYDE